MSIRFCHILSFSGCFFKLKPIVSIYILLHIGLFSKDVKCWSESPQENGFEENLYKNDKDVDKENIASPVIMGMLDANDKPDLLNLRIDSPTMSEVQNNLEFPIINMLSNTPYVATVKRANLHSKAKNSKSSVNKWNKKNNRLSKTSTSKSIPKLDKVNEKVLELDCGCLGLPSVNELQQESQVGKNGNPCEPRLVNSADAQKDGENADVSISENGQNLKDVHDYLNTIPKRVDFSQVDNNKQYILNNVVTPEEHSDYTQKDINKINDKDLITPEEFTLVLQEQNNILKELLFKMVYYNNLTTKANYEDNTRRVHLILDINNIGNRSFDLELNPIFKLRNEYDQSNLNMALKDDENWVKFNSKANIISNINSNVPEKISCDHAQNAYVPYLYNDPVVDVLPTQDSIFNEYEPSKRPSYCTCNYCRQHNVTPQNSNGVYVSTTDKTSAISTSYNDVASVPPHYNYYKGFIKSPTSQPYSKSYHVYQKPRYPYYGLQYNYV